MPRKNYSDKKMKRKANKKFEQKKNKELKKLRHQMISRNISTIKDQN